MNRSPAHRLAALLVTALFFLAWGGEAVGAHSCPHHGGVVPGAHEGGPSHTAPAAHEDHAHHPEPGHSDAPEHGGCTCVTGCPSGAGSLLPPDVALGLQATLTRFAPRAFPPIQSSAPLLTPYLLPYSQAPPLG